MKYRISQVPNTQTAKRFKVQNPEGNKEVVFSFSKEILTVWANPLDPKLGEVMIAYIKKNGWSKEPVSIGAANSQQNLNRFIASLNQAKAGK